MPVKNGIFKRFWIWLFGSGSVNKPKNEIKGQECPHCARCMALVEAIVNKQMALNDVTNNDTKELNTSVEQKEMSEEEEIAFLEKAVPLPGAR